MTGTALSGRDVVVLFTSRDGSYRFSRGGRTIAPVVFGVDDETFMQCGLPRGLAC